MSGSSTGWRAVARRVGRELKALAAPVLMYALSVGLGWATFALAVALSEPLTVSGVVMLVALGSACALGVGLGQLLSLSRLRSGLVLPGLFVAFILGIYLVAQEGAIASVLPVELTAAILMHVLLVPIMASGGFWSLRVNRGLAAAWAPAILFIGAILVVSQASNRDLLWHEGNKHAIWSVGSLLMLGAAALTQVGFMAARERHRLHRWRTDPRAPELVDPTPDPIRPLAGLGSLAALAALALVLTLSTALVAPYLWRTGPADRGDRERPVSTQEDPEPVSGPARPLPSLPEIVRQGVSMACALLTMVVLALAGLFVFGLPARRQLLIAHLRDPMWPVAPSRRARLHWRLAEIALGDAGVHRKPGEAARDVAGRGVAALPWVNLEPLQAAAAIADRVAYGYAMEASDADTLRRAAEMTYQAVWESLGELDRVKATYRFL